MFSSIYAVQKAYNTTENKEKQIKSISSGWQQEAPLLDTNDKCLRQVCLQILKKSDNTDIVSTIDNDFKQLCCKVKAAIEEDEHSQKRGRYCHGGWEGN